MGAGAMAPGAGRARMTTDQRVIRQRMIERRAGKADQRKSAPMMVAMTGAAFLRSRSGAPVKPLMRRNIAGNPTVTGKAAVVLRGSCKRYVAAIACRFEPCVRTRQGARRNQPLHDALRAGAVRAQHQRNRKKQARPQSHQYICTATMCNMAVRIRMKNSGK